MNTDDRWAERLREQVKDVERSADTVTQSLRESPYAVNARDGVTLGPDDAGERRRPGPDEV